MRTSSSLLLLLLTAGSVNLAAQERPVDLTAERKAVEDAISLMERSLSVLEGVKDGASAAIARRELTTVEKDGDYRRKLDLYLALPQRTTIYWESKIGPRADKVLSACLDRYKNLRSLPDVLPILRDTAVVRYVDHIYSRISDHSINRLIDPALGRYWDQHRNYPDSLEQLTKTSDAKTGKPFLLTGTLVDQWGRRFEYDKKGPKNKGERPDVWSSGPPHWPISPWVISNWKPFYYSKWTKD